MVDQERLSLLALHFVPGIGDFLLKQLVSYCGTAEEVFRRPIGKLLKIPGIGNATTAAIKRGSTFALAEQEFRKAETEDAEILFFIDKRYPARLKIIDDAPAVIYLKGTCNLNCRRTVAIVGTRQASSYGRAVVEKAVEDLTPHQPLVISGLAYGIDIHAHKQALKFNLPTLGVLGSGLDVLYPQAHREVAHKMMNRGGLATENPFGTKPDAHNFPSRNRIIAGLCDALIVIEAAETGGALITAEIANSYNKDVFAVPGAVGQTFSEGCNRLIKTHKANLFTSVSDLEYVMNWAPGSASAEERSSVPVDAATLSHEEKQIVQAIEAKSASMQIDELSWKTGIPQGALASILLNLEFKNILQSLPGKIYRLVRSA